MKAILEYNGEKTTIVIPAPYLMISKLLNFITKDGVSNDELPKEYFDAYTLLCDFYVEMAEGIFEEDFLIHDGFFKVSKKDKKEGVIDYMTFSRIGITN